MRVCFSSSTNAVKKVVKSPRSSFDMSKLTRLIESELKYNKEWALEQDNSKIEQVTEKWANMLNDQGWAVSCKENSTIVEMTTERGDMKVVVRFDAEMVADSVNESSMAEGMEEVSEEAESREEMLEEDELAEEDMEDYGPQPFNMTVELHRPTLQGRFVEMEMEAIPGPASEGGDHIYINSIAIRHAYSTEARETYSGPQFDSLEEDLRSQFETWAEKNLRHLVPFVTELSQAKENAEYESWLTDLKTFTESSK